MNRNLRFLAIVIFAASGLCLPTAGIAQDQQGQTSQGGQTPKPPARTYGPIGVEGQDQDQTPEILQPDNHPLTGFQPITVGTPVERHSYWVPGVSYTNFVQSTGALQGGGTGWSSTSFLAGNMSLLENWSRSQLAVNYSGGGNFSTDSTVGNGWFQQISANQTFNWERLQLTLLDEFAYLPQAQFGFGAGTGLATAGVGGSLGGSIAGILNSLNPGQSVFSAVGPRYVNTGGAQVNYQLTRRSSITIGGLVSTLRFSDKGNIESNDYVGNAGFNYQINRNDTIGFLYRYSAFHFLNAPQAIGDHTIQLAYGKKITGRLALQLSAGPEITDTRTAQGPGAKTHNVNGSGNVNVTYALQRGSVSATYFHGVTGGSGVFEGATTDQVTGTASRRLTRVWSGDLHMGYSRNRSTETLVGVNNNNYNTLFAGAAASRPLGRNAGFTLAYTAYVESANNTVCAGANCGTSFTVNQVSVGLSWHTRPLVLR